MSIDPSDGYEQAVKHILSNHLKTDDCVDFRVFTDGSVSTEGAVGLGWVICSPTGSIVCTGSRKFSVEQSTSFSNVAEALAIKSAVNQLISMDWFDSEVKLYCDNKSVVAAFERETKLWSVEEFNVVRKQVNADNIVWVQREYNTVADAISTKAQEKV